MNTASFFRNVADYNVLCRQTALYAGVVATYHIVSTIYLEEETFQTFCSNFQKSYDFLLPYINVAVVKSDIWNSILITNGIQKLLVVMNHYQYARYVSLIS